MSLLPIGIHFGVLDADYRTDPGISQSTVKDFGRARTPFHFKHGLIKPRKDTEGLRIGSYVDCAIHGTVQDLDERFAVLEGFRKGKGWKTFRVDNAHKILLNKTEADKAAGCILALACHDDTQKIIAASNKQVMVVAQHPVHQVRLKALIDLKPDRAKCSELLWPYLFDIKISEDASPDGFSDWCYTWGYDIQAYHYIKMAEYAGEYVEAFAFIVVESMPPHQIKIHFIKRGYEVFNCAEQKFEQWLLSYCHCRDKDLWPSYGEEWSEILFKPWQLTKYETERETLL